MRVISLDSVFRTGIKEVFCHPGLPELLKSDGGVGPEPELGVVVCGRFLERPVPREGDGLNGHEVNHEEIPEWLARQTADGLLQTDLDGAHQLGRLELLEGDAPILGDPSVTQLLALVLLLLLLATPGPATG